VRRESGEKDGREEVQREEDGGEEVRCKEDWRSCVGVEACAIQICVEKIDWQNCSHDVDTRADTDGGAAECAERRNAHPAT
jgi:hypothetical protein